MKNANVSPKVLASFMPKEVQDAMTKTLPLQEEKDAAVRLEGLVRNVNKYIEISLTTAEGRKFLFQSLTGKRNRTGASFNPSTLFCMTKVAENKELSSFLMAYVRTHFSKAQAEKYASGARYFTAREVHSLIAKVAKTEGKDTPLFPARFIAFLQESTAKDKDAKVATAKKVMRLK